MNKLISHTNITPQHQSLVGNKALRLAQIARAGITTAPFFVIPASADITSPDLVEKISARLNLEPPIRYAVRSSANCEDGNTASFAGQFESYLSLSAEDVISAIGQCRLSAKRDSVVAYCRYHKLDPCKIKMAVIVQHMISADKGGVIYTHDIFSKRNAVVIEAVKGLGEQVVSGAVDSQKYVLDRTTAKPLERFLDSSPSVLSAKELDQLFHTTKKIEQLFKSPQDIEWAILKDELFILQSRPLI